MAAVGRAVAGARLVTLTGPGGVGKTRLALRVARAAAVGKADPGNWRSLGPTARRSRTGWGSSPGPRGRSGPGGGGGGARPGGARRRRAPAPGGAAGRPAGALPAAGAGQLRAPPGGGGAPGGKPAGGRAGAAGAGHQPGPAAGGRRAGVPCAPPDPTPRRLPRWARSESEAVALFVERARAARPDFALSAENGAHIAEVCRRLDGLPLALELAAARVRLFTVAQIVARLDDRFRLLTAGPRTALPHQQTLRATVDWSYALLAAPAQTLLRRLSVFAGGWTFEAAEAVAAGDGIRPYAVLDLLAQLVDESLVISEEQRGSVALPPAGDDPRVRRRTAAGSGGGGAHPRPAPGLFPLPGGGGRAAAAGTAGACRAGPAGDGARQPARGPGVEPDRGRRGNQWRGNQWRGEQRAASRRGAPRGSAAAVRGPGLVLVDA